MQITIKYMYPYVSLFVQQPLGHLDIDHVLIFFN
jgi:hypothetical protein